MNGKLSPEILRAVLDSYLHTRTSLLSITSERPDLLTNGSALAAFRSQAIQTVRLQATKSAPDPSVRYYFSLLALTAGMGTMLVGYAIRNAQPKGSVVGARRSLGGVPRWRVLLGTILGAWACQFICMLAAIVFMRVVVGVNFGNYPVLVIGATLVSSLMACAAGSFFGGGTNIEPGMVSGVSSLLSLFTRLFGEASQRLADTIETTVPILSHANPLWQMSNCFYSLLYYDTLEPFITSCLTLLAMAALFFSLAALRMRRISHDQL
jgi:ABC-2 type transport system permease protein